MATCLKCEGTHKYIDELTGLEIDCTCDLAGQPETTLQGQKKSKQDAKDYALIHSIIPEDRIDDEFDINFLKSSIREMSKAEGYIVKNFNAYEEALNNITGKIILGEKKHSSYLIAAPNGFGKTTFVNTAIKACILQGWTVAPYTSLLEIRELQLLQLGYLKGLTFPGEADYKNVKAEREQKERVFESFEQRLKDIYIKKGITYRDFTEAKLLFISLSSPAYSDIELPALKFILNERAKVQRATIVMSEYPIRDYQMDPLCRNFWLDHLEMKGFGKSSMDRLTYVTCTRYKSGASGGVYNE